MTKPVIFGLSGLELTEIEKEFFKDNEVYGFILFKRNIESAEQLRNLINSLKQLYPARDTQLNSLRFRQSEVEPRVLAQRSNLRERSQDSRNSFVSTLMNDAVPIFVDQEGGRVARIKPPIAAQSYPAMEVFSNLYDSERVHALKETETNYQVIMKELKSLGIDCGCTPVADLRFSYTDNVIGDRSFGETPEKVVELCEAAIDGINKAEGLVVIKHIPGHGRATSDSHLSLPHVSTPLAELDKTDFEVFRQLSKNPKVDFAMTAHIVFDALDPELPVTLSPKAIGFIREDIGFKGLLMTDDLCMKALHANINPEIKSEYLANLKYVTKQALLAGCDVILHCSGDIEEMRAVASTI